MIPFRRILFQCPPVKAIEDMGVGGLYLRYRKFGLVVQEIIYGNHVGCRGGNANNDGAGRIDNV